MIAIRWTLVGIMLFTCACRQQNAQPIQLVLVPPASQSGSIEATLAAEGLGALLLSRLRTIPGARVRIDPAGCASTLASSHALSISHEDIERSALITLRLRDCDSGVEHQEILVQPRHARREWSGESAFWVAHELRVPLRLPTPGAAVDESVMTRFLAAVAKLQRRTRNDVAEARTDLDAIVTQHPDFALGQAELAAAQLLAYEYGIESRTNAFAAADRASSTALLIDPDLGLAHGVRGLALMMESRYRDAAPVLARAAALDPGNATILLWMGNALLYSGHPTQAVPWLDRAVAMEPLLISAHVSRAEAACYSGDDVRCQIFLDAGGDAATGGFVRSLLRAHRGDFHTARDALEAGSNDINETWALELKADVCAVLDDRACLDNTLAMMAANHADDPETRRTQLRLQNERGRSTITAAELFKLPPEIDLWQIDLGLDAWMQVEQRRTTLDAQLDQWRDNGLKLPVLDVASACLMSLRGDADGASAMLADLRARHYHRDDLWRRWQCAKP